MAASANTACWRRRFGFAVSLLSVCGILAAEALARMPLSSPLSRTAYDTQELGQEETLHGHACLQSALHEQPPAVLKQQSGKRLESDLKLLFLVL